MPRAKDPFDIDTLIDAPSTPTPLPIEQRVQSTAVRPYGNPQYLASHLSDVRGMQHPRSGGLSYSFTCPTCGNEAKLMSGFTSDGPFTLSCSGKCAPEALRNTLAAHVPLAFEIREDIVYPFTPELEHNVVDAAVAGKVMMLDHDERYKLKKFRGIAPDIKSFAYRAPGGAAVMQVFRRDNEDGSKNFLPARVRVDVSDRADVEFAFPSGALPIYNWDDLATRPDARVVLVEGEQTADQARAVFPHYVIVTSACGAYNAGKSDWSPLHDRDVVIWRDNDQAGEHYERAAAAHALSVRAKSVRRVVLPSSLPVGWDLADPLPDGMTQDDLNEALASAVEVRWDEVKDALAPRNNRCMPPFRLPDGLFATDKKMLEAVEQSLAQLDSGCGKLPWLGVLGAIYHAFGDAGLAMADAWSQRDADKHGKYHAGEVHQIFERFSIAPQPMPMPLLILFRIAMKAAKDAGGESPWKPSPIPLTTAYIAEFESKHRKVREGDNITIAVQEQNVSGEYKIGFISEPTAESLYRSKKAPDFKGDKINLYTLWQNYPLLEPMTLVFKPGGHVAPNELNLFRGLDVQPMKGGSYTLFLEHLEHVMIANGDTDRFLLKVMAFRLQNLHTFVACLLAFIGPEGSGKSTITKVIARLLAPYSISLSDPEKFVGRNNASLQGKLYVQLEEMILGRREDYDSRLKHYITSDVLDVEEKYKAQWQIENHLFVAMTANKLSVVRVTEHSRRFALYEVEDRFGGDEAQREDFFGRMWAELEAGGYEALAYDLMNMDLTGFSAKRVPKTGLYMELTLADADRDPLRAWWREILETGDLGEADAKETVWSAPINKDQFYRKYQAWCEGDGPRSKLAILSKAEWAKQLRKMLPGGLQAKRVMSAGTRSHNIVLPAYEQCCSFFEKLYGREIERAAQPGKLKAVM